MPRKDILTFLESPLAFDAACSPGEKELWTRALAEVVQPTIAAKGLDPLTGSQVAAWNDAASHRVALLLGPPGTGKTTTLGWMGAGYAECARRSGRPARVLVTAFTRASIANGLTACARKLEALGSPITTAWLGKVADEEELHPATRVFVQPRDALALLGAGPAVVGGTAWFLFRMIAALAKDGRADGLTAPLFDLVCIDEASQMLVGQGLLSLAGLLAGGRVIVAGDNRQLAPVKQTHDREIDGRKLGSSLYDFLAHAKVREVALEETFRLNAPLAGFPAEQFYGGKYKSLVPGRRLRLRAGWGRGLAPWELNALDPESPVVVVLHDGPPHGTRNPFEARLAARLAGLLRDRVEPLAGKAPGEGFWDEQVAIVSPHRAHNAAIRELLAGTALGEGCVVETVDRIQGRERDAILATYAVSDAEFAGTEAEFLFSPERFNVTVTRARSKLVLVMSRRLLEVVPNDGDVMDAARILREFVFTSAHLGDFEIDGEDGAVGIELRVRRFPADAPPAEPERAAPPAKPQRVVSPAPADRPVPALTPHEVALLDAIRAVAAENEKYGNAAGFEVKKRLGRISDVPLRDLAALAAAGHVSVAIRKTKTGSEFWVATPHDVPKPPLPCDPVTVAKRIGGVIESTRKWGSPWYGAVRAAFDWIGLDGSDRFEPALAPLLASEAVVKGWTARGDPTLEVGEVAPEGPPPPPARRPGDAEFSVLNALEDMESGWINFGVFERWATVRELARRVGCTERDVSAALQVLADDGWVLVTPGGRVRSRMAELARETRYVKQRFSVDDADERPFLVRALKMEVKNRNKPERKRSWASLRDRLVAVHHQVADLPRVLDGIAEMLREKWKLGVSDDPLLSGFQERAVEEILGGWLGAGASTDAVVITADTGSGKTEAALLPLIAGAALDALAGIHGVRAVLVYPRIRLAANQAERLADYLAAFSRIPGMPTLLVGMQNQDVLKRQADDDEGWPRERGGRGFPFFACPRCGGSLLMEFASGVRLGEGAKAPRADRLTCTAGECGWDYRGWVGTREAVRRLRPHFFLPVTESLHHWQSDADAGGMFGDGEGGGAPAAVLADEIHLYSHVHGAQVGYTLRRLLARAELNRPPGGRPRRTLAIGMSATIGDAQRFWAEMCGRDHVTVVAPLPGDRSENPRGREYFYFVQPEVESRGRDVAGASTTIQSLMVLSHGMRRRTGKEGGFRGLVFLDSIDKLKRLHADYRDAEEGQRLAKWRVRYFPDDPQTGEPRQGCCDSPETCDVFRAGECWWFAANDRRQVGARGRYVPGRPLAVCSIPVFSGSGKRIDRKIKESDVVFSTSSLEVGFDDPDMTLVYQHYAPANLASFVQRKGRGGRGSDDRPITGVTLSVHSPRDTWYFRRPGVMLDAVRFEIPLNMENFFVLRGQLLSFLLDLSARGGYFKPASLEILRGAEERLAQAVSLVFGPDALARLEADSVAGFLGQVATEFRRAPGQPFDAYRKRLSWVPRALFQSINLPLLAVTYPDENGSVGNPKLEDVSLAFNECAPGNVTRRFGFAEAHWVPPVVGLATWGGGGEARAWVRQEILPPGEPLLGQLPAEAQAVCVRFGLAPKVARPTTLRMESAGRFEFASWKPGAAWDAAKRAVMRPAEGLPSVYHRSEGDLRGATIVRTRPGAGRVLDLGGAWRGARAVRLYRGSPTNGKRTGLAVHHVYWGCDVRLQVDDGLKREDVFLRQTFRSPVEEKVELVGYSLETEGIQVDLDEALLDAFVEGELATLHPGGTPTSEGRWLHAQHFRFALQQECISSKFTVWDAQAAAELCVTAAGIPGGRARLVAAAAPGAPPASLADLLGEGRAALLSHHPTHTQRRFDRLREDVLLDPDFHARLTRALRSAADAAEFRNYVRSLVLHGVALKLRDAFVRHGCGVERSVRFHVRLPIQYGVPSSVVSVFENGNHGDGTTRTFEHHVREAFAELEDMAECPNADEDRMMAELDGREAEVSRWRRMDPREDATVRLLARELGIDPMADGGAFQAVQRILYGREEVSGQVFEFYELHREIAAVRRHLLRGMEREPSVWELVSMTVEESRAEHPVVALPKLRALLGAYRRIEEAVPAEGSLGAEGRLAEQVYRLSSRLCIDGCPACLHTGSSLMENARAEVAVSRRVLARFAEFVKGASGTSAGA